MADRAARAGTIAFVTPRFGPDVVGGSAGTIAFVDAVRSHLGAAGG